MLCEEIELKMSAICLNRHCPFILEPKSSFHTVFDRILLLVILLQIIWIPYVFAFEHTLNATSFSILFLFDSFYFFDIYLQLSTAIKHKHHTVAEVLNIAVERIKHGWFLVDLLATVPVDYAAYLIQSQGKLIVLFKLNRLLKAYKLIAYMIMKENEIIVDIIRMKFMKYILIYAIMCKLIVKTRSKIFIVHHL